MRLEAQVMFEAAWRRFEARHPDFLRRARVPRECVFLQGAPAAGKGTHTPAICDSRALARVISMSGLLETSPLAREAIDRGEMIDDALVGDALLEALLAPPTPAQMAALAAPVAAACPPPPPLLSVAGGTSSSTCSSPPPLTTPAASATTTTSSTPAPGVLIDGFPRTAMQVDFLKLLHERLLSLHDAAAEQQQQQQASASDGNGNHGNNQMLEEAAARFPRVAFRVVALFVDEATSLARQQGRAKRTAQLNARVLDAASLAPLPPAPPHPAAAAAAGAAALLPAGAIPVPSPADDDDSPDHHHHSSTPPPAEDLLDGPRATDADEQRAKTRYAVFRRHYPSLLRLRAFLPFHLVDASGDEDDVRDAILSELRYQSSVELSAAAYGVVRTLPLASDLQAAARQALVSRLDGYASQRPRLLHEVAALLRREAVPILRRAGLVGRAEWLTRASVFEAAAAAGASDAAATATSATGAASSTDDASSSSSTHTPSSPSEEAVDMVVDLLSDRGFNASHTREEQLVPTRFDTKTGEVLSVEPRLVAHRFSITFEAPGVRQLRAMETAARVAETSAAAMGGVGALSAGGFAAAVVARKPSPAALGAAVERVHQKLAERERARREAHARALREVEERQKQQQSQEQDAAAVAG